MERAGPLRREIDSLGWHVAGMLAGRGWVVVDEGDQEEQFQPDSLPLHQHRAPQRWKQGTLVDGPEKKIEGYTRWQQLPEAVRANVVVGAADL